MFQSLGYMPILIFILSFEYSCKKDKKIETPPRNSQDYSQAQVPPTISNDYTVEGEESPSASKPSNLENNYVIPIVDSFYKTAEQQIDLKYHLIPQNLVKADDENLYLTGIRRTKEMEPVLDEVFLLKFNLNHGWDSHRIFIPVSLDNEQEKESLQKNTLDLKNTMHFNSGKIVALVNQHSFSTESDSPRNSFHALIFGANDAGLLRKKNFASKIDHTLTAVTSFPERQNIIAAGTTAHDLTTIDKRNSQAFQHSFISLLDEEGEFQSYLTFENKDERITQLKSIQKDLFVATFEYQNKLFLRSYRIHSFSAAITPISEIEFCHSRELTYPYIKASSIDTDGELISVSADLHKTEEPSGEDTIPCLFQVKIYPNGILSQHASTIFLDSMPTKSQTSFLRFTHKNLSFHRSRENISHIGKNVQVSSHIFPPKNILTDYKSTLWELFRFDSEESLIPLLKQDSHQRILKAVLWPGPGIHEKYFWFLSEHRFIHPKGDNSEGHSWIHLGSYVPL